MLTIRSTTVLIAFSRLRRWLPVLVVAAGLAGCGGGGGGGVVNGVAASRTASEPTNTAGTNTTGNTTSNPTTQDVTIAGSVGDGPVTGAKVTVYDTSGAVLDSMVSDSTATYRKTLKVKGSQYPLRLVVSGGIDLVTGRAPDFKMVSVMLRVSDKAVNINPFSTLIVNTAQRMPGGLTASNVNRARTAVIDKLGFGLDTNTMADPVTTPVTSSNAANIVKASEALGELVRRTRDTIAATGMPSSGSSVVTALSADLVDGFVDGLGASGTDATVSAVASVVSAQVLVEAMSNNLRVGGVVATNVIDQSIRSTHAGISNTQLSGSVRINSQMIGQAGIAVAAAQVVDPSGAVATVKTKIAGLRTNSTASSVAAILPAGTTDTLSGATNQVARASAATLTQVNQVVFAQGDTGTTTASSGSTGTGGSTGSTGSGTSGGTSGSTGSTGSGTTGGTSGSTGSAGPTATGSFKLSWTAPTARSDGSPLSLSAIDGYRIYYGSQRGSYPNNMNITDGTARGATITNLSSGTYYLVMTTYDNSGLESSYSPEVVKNVP